MLPDSSLEIEEQVAVAAFNMPKEVKVSSKSEDDAVDQPQCIVFYISV